MIFFSEINSQNPNYSFVEQLFLSAFPIEERSPEILQRQNIDGNPSMHCLLVTDVDDCPLGFITYWRFDGFSYIEHFAIAPEFRNRGVGAEVVAAFVEMQHRPVVLEAELPNVGELAVRRIQFYLRNGFEAMEYDYLQPAYPGRAPGGVPMQLLVHNADSGDELPFSYLRGVIYRNVYGVEP